MAAATPRIASEDSVGRHHASPPGPVFTDGVQGVLAAGGVKPTVPAHESAEGGAIAVDEEDEDARDGAIHHA